MAKLRTMRRDDWTMITRKSVFLDELQYKNLSGKVSLLRMDEVSKPFTVNDITICDTGYYWMQIAFRNQFFWMTCMFDDNSNFFDIYVDITNGNVVDVEDPYFEDMYLDFDVTKDEIFRLDRDELDDAFSNNLITKEEYNRTIHIEENLYQYLLSHHQEIIEDVTTKFIELKKKM